MLTREQIIDQLFKNGKTNTRIVQLMNSGARPELQHALISLTSFLPPDSNVNRRLWHIINNVDIIPTCLCGVNLSFKRLTVGYGTYCKGCPESWAASKGKRDQTIQARYGVANTGLIPSAMEKRKLTNLAKYGVEFPLQNREVLKKTHTTQVETTGNWGFKLNSRRRTAEQVKIELYGTTHGNPSCYSHITEAMRSILDDGDLLRKWHHEDHLSATEIAENLGVCRSTILQAFKSHDIQVQRHHQSAQERKIHNLLKELGVEFTYNDRKLVKPLELDIVIPSAKVAIEINGMWYHSERYGYDKKRHLDKTLKCEAEGYRLIHLWEYEIEHKWERCRDIIMSAVGQVRKIGARTTTIVELTANDQKQFFEQYHIQGCGNVAPICYGLVHDGQLVAAMSFGKPRYSNQAEWELLRYAVKSELSVVGGASKLFAHFVKQHTPISVVSYCDRRLFTGRMYEQLRFNNTHASAPNYWYFEMPVTKLYHRANFQKHMLAKKLGTFDPTLTEWENMKANEWNRVWDCGNSVWLWQS